MPSPREASSGVEQKPDPPFLHRGRTDIIASMLEAATEMKGKTQLMYRSKLDSRELKKYLNFLLSCELIKAVESFNPNQYKTTSKGFRYLREHEKLESLERPSRSGR